MHKVKSKNNSLFNKKKKYPAYALETLYETTLKVLLASQNYKVWCFDNVLRIHRVCNN